MSANPQDILNNLTNNLNRSVNELGSNNDAEKQFLQARLMADVMSSSEPKPNVLMSTLGHGAVTGLANMIANSNNYNISSNDAFFQGMLSGGMTGFNKAQEARQRWEEQAHENNRAVYRTVLSNVLNQPETQAKILYYASNSLGKLTEVGGELTGNNDAVTLQNTARAAMGIPLIDNANGYGIDIASQKESGKVLGNSQRFLTQPKTEARLKKEYKDAYDNKQAFAQGRSQVRNGIPVNNLSGGIQQNYAVPIFMDEAKQQEDLKLGVDNYSKGYKEGHEQREKTRHSKVGEYNTTRKVTSEIGRIGVQNQYTKQQMDKNVNPEKYPLLRKQLEKSDNAIIKTDNSKAQIKARLSSYGNYKPEILDLHADYLTSSESYSQEEKQKLRQIIKKKTGIDPEESYKYLIKQGKPAANDSGITAEDFKNWQDKQGKKGS